LSFCPPTLSFRRNSLCKNRLASFFPPFRFFSVIPGLFFSSFRRKPESLFLLRPRHRKGARSARFICWIPAFAGMAEGGLYSLDARGVFTQPGRPESLMESARFALLLRQGRSARYCNVRVPRAILRGIPAFAGMTKRGCRNDRKKREWRKKRGGDGFCTDCFLRITPPLRGSRQDEGASPKSRRWGEHRKRLPRPAACENRKGRGAAYPHRGSRRLAACLPRLPLKGGVMGKKRCGNGGKARRRRFLHSLAGRNPADCFRGDGEEKMRTGMRFNRSILLR